MDYFEELIKWIKAEKPTKEQIAKKKVVLCREHKRKNIPTDIEVYLHADSKDSELIRGLLETKPTRTGSGVAVVAVMMAPFNCPHGKCIMCPGGVESIFGDVPQSYTPKSPPVLRAEMLKYHAFEQIKSRLKSFDVMNHPTGKIELIIMGGNFLDYPIKYQYEFVKKCYDGLNGRKSKTLEEAKKRNEKSKHRCVALCLETRPDTILKEGVIPTVNNSDIWH